mgnify:CR=1 FL=1
MLTLEERERRAYIEGRVEEAALIAAVVDEASLPFEDELHDLRGRLDDVQNVVWGLRAQISAAVRALS